MVGKRPTAETIIADAIKNDPGIVDRLADYNPVFGKLRNPILRKTMAKLATFRDAARIAGVPVETLLAVAEGRQPPEIEIQDTTELPPPPRPPWLTDDLIAAASRVDARKLLQNGGNPLGDVMRAAKGVETGALLIVDAPFDPVPLRRVLSGKGFEDHTESAGPDHWLVFFRRVSNAESSQSSNTDGPKRWSEDGILHIDVRGLEPPQPMVEILNLIDSGAAHDTLIVHHEREPVFLYPELAERNWAHEVVEDSDGEVRLCLTKSAT